MLVLGYSSAHHISIHAPVRERPRECMVSSLPSGFQSRPPCGSDLLRRAVGGTGEHFNPRSRVGSDPGSSLSELPVDISIHAPVWGATIARPGPHQRRVISIHAPVWGATANAHKPLASFQCRFDIFAQKKAKHPMFYLYSTTISCVFKTFFSAKVRCFLWALPLRTLSLSII